MHRPMSSHKPLVKIQKIALYQEVSPFNRYLSPTTKMILSHMVCPLLSTGPNVLIVMYKPKMGTVRCIQATIYPQSK
ncbi:hypothetical protein K450DRAFT_257604 [Umbelopsis ramanniana AG]|uniref:Uncharacterized protein n=1 Tax=Umbelopsis ramanniana AG TaxID=1314678 RepID=A0AAD5H9I3_UMBRA|nr:uncharacterized protein K450DRAFT_257604 [Umbelopsis ramanniana AG]KAI8576300.1 hypothetical protein K450DRAFT_257604 [Umbelopsis ramanniana AG]